MKENNCDGEHIQELESVTLSNTTQYWTFHKNTFQIQEKYLDLLKKSDFSPSIGTKVQEGAGHQAFAGLCFLELYLLGKLAKIKIK